MLPCHASSNLPSLEFISIVNGGRSTNVRMQSIPSRMHSFVLHLLLNIKSFGILLSIFFGYLEVLNWNLKISQVSKQCHFPKLPKSSERCFIFFSKTLSVSFKKGEFLKL